MRLIKLFLITSLILYYNFTSNLYGIIKNNIAIKVENQIITNYEIRNKILTSIVLSGKEINQSNIDNFKKQSVSSLIDQKLILKELTKYKIEDDNLQINQYLNSISSNDIKKFKKMFFDNNLDYSLFLEEVKTKLKWQKLIYRIYSDRINIDENFLNNEVLKIVKNQKKIQEFKLSEIEIFLKNDTSDKYLISNVKKEILENGFEKTALKYSVSDTSNNKGSLGWVNSTSLSNQIYEIVSKLSIGSVSEPVIINDTALFLLLEKKRETNPVDLNEAELKIKIKNKKTNDLYNLYSKSHLSKLKNNSLIEYQ